MRQETWRRYGADGARMRYRRGAVEAQTGRGRSANGPRTQRVCCGGAGEHVPGGAANGATACVQRDEPLASRGFSCEPSPNARL